MSDQKSARDIGLSFLQSSLESFNTAQGTGTFVEEGSIYGQATVLALHAVYNELRHGHDQQAKLAEAIDGLNTTIMLTPGLRADPPNG